MDLNNNIITTIMANGNYGVNYEPIICLKEMKTVAYEALSRFMCKGNMISPASFFKSIHDDIELFFYIETILKKFQLDNRPDDKKLFLNVDPDIAIDSNHIEFWVKLFNSHDNILIEIIENSDEESAQDIEYFMDWMDEYNLPYAYDDYSKPNSMFFSSLLHRSNTIKLDIDFLRSIKKNKAYIEIAKGVANYARLSNKYTILEGIESESDLSIAREIGVDFVQGYLFKEQFILKWNS